MSVRDKWVRRFSIDETAKHKNGFTIYKITSVLFPLGSPEAVTVVSVWKRYSDVQRLHRAVRALHAGLHLRGTCPALPKTSYFKRFSPEVIEERAKTIKALLEFVAEHRLLFTSTDFVNFLQTGYPEPAPAPGGVINAIRSSLHLPIEDTPPLEYQTSDDEARSPTGQTPRSPQRTTDNPPHIDNIDVSQIPIYEAADVEIRESPKTTEQLSNSNSFESLNSLESLGSDLYDELNKVTVDSKKSFVKRNVLPDLINFDAPSTSKFEDYHNMPHVDADGVSLDSSANDPSSSYEDSRRSGSRVSLYSKRSVLSLSNVESRTRTEDSYIFEAGYMLNLAARCEDAGDHQRAFECYKSGIEKMLIGVQTDSDQQRRALIKEKTNKYLAYAEAIYTNHLSNADQSLLPEREDSTSLVHCSIPLSMLRRPYEELAQYRVLAVLGASVMLVLHRNDHTCYAMKVIQKIPNNLTEFDNYFQQRSNETRQPILPTVIPYMVPLHAYVETDHLIFLILAYAPGERLFDYIKHYVQSVPNTPARELNLENVFAEPRRNKIDHRNDNDRSVDVTDANVNIEAKINAKLGDCERKIDSKANLDMDDNVNVEARINAKLSDDGRRIDSKTIDVTDANVNIEARINAKLGDGGHRIDSKAKIDMDDNVNIGSSEYKMDSSVKFDDTGSKIDSKARIDVLGDINENVGKTDSLDSMDVSELVMNSQKLLLNVDRALTDVPRIYWMEEDSDIQAVEEKQGGPMDKKADSAERVETPSRARLSPRLHRRDVLPPSGVCLWGAQILTALESLHNAGVICRDLNPSNILLGERGQIILTYFVSYPGRDVFMATMRTRGHARAYVAPELRAYACLDDSDPALERVCDFWSFGAIMFELICGYPLHATHPHIWSHSLVQLPDGLPLEARSLLSQLLTYSPAERLGGGAGGVADIKQHPYFRHIHWEQVYDAWSVPD